MTKHLRGYHDGRFLVQKSNFITDRRHVAVPEGNESARPYPHQLARWGLPMQLAVQGASLQVQAPVVMPYIRTGDAEWLIIYKQAYDFAVCHVQHGLAGAGETVGGFAVDNR